MLGGSARWGRWSGSRSPSAERDPAAVHSQLVVEAGRSCSDTELAGDRDSPGPPAGGAGSGARPRSRTYSLTRLHYSVFLEPDGETAATAATLPRVRPPITIIGEETQVVDGEPVSDSKQKRKKKPLRRLLSVENLRKSVRKSRERIQGMDEVLRKQARKTLRRMRTDKKDAAASPSPTPDLPQVAESDSEPSASPSPSPSPPRPALSPPSPPPEPPEPPEPTEPTEPTKPTEPTEPTGPTEPTEPTEPPERNEIAFADDSLTTSEESRATPVPPELSIQHELELAEQASRADASAATRPTGEPERGGGGGGARCASPADDVMGPSSDQDGAAAQEQVAENEELPAPAPAPSPAATGEDAQVEQAERAIEEAERARHRLLSDHGDNEVGNKYEHLYKILIIGELGTGKTSIIKRYVHQFFSAHYRATIGVDFALKVLHWDPNTIVRLQLWDIAGQERFGSMTRVYYKEAVAAFIVFDVTRSVTFDAIMKWKNDLDEKVQLPNGDSVPCVLLANKCDLPKEGLVSTPEKLTEWAEQHGFLGWFETSAKENTGIEEAANFLVTKILAHEKSGNLATEGEDPDMLAVGDGQPTSKGCSC